MPKTPKPPSPPTHNTAAAQRCGAHGQVVLVLQGGGALGAYQLGVYQALHESGIEPDWVIGTSIGAINAALIAGNAPADRLTRLHSFWAQITQPALPAGPAGWWLNGLAPGLGQAAQTLNAVLRGVPGFFEPNPAALYGSQAPVGVDQAAYYRTEPLRQTLGALLTPARLAGADTRLTVGAVNALSGQMHYFDSRSQPLSLDHVMASGALPPAFPAVALDGQPFWDGGLYSNTPLEVVLDDNPRRDSLIFSVDVWQQAGPAPESIWQVMGRQKDIQFASRADSHLARHKQIHQLRHVIRELARQLPPEQRADPAVQALAAWGCATTMHVARLQAPALPGEDHTKDIDFSAAGIQARRAAGHADTLRLLARAPWQQPADPLAGVVEHR